MLFTRQRNIEEEVFMVVMHFYSQYLVINCVKFGQEDAIDSMRLVLEVDKSSSLWLNFVS